MKSMPQFNNTSISSPTTTTLPNAIRPGRLGIRIRNVATPTATNGIIRVLNTSQTFNGTWTANASPATSILIDEAAQLQIQATMKTDPNVRTITAYDLLEERQFTILPCSESYHIYDEYRQATLETSSSTQIGLAAALNNAEAKAAMGCVIIEVPNNATANAVVLSYTIMSDDVVRFAANSTLAYLHKTPAHWSSQSFGASVSGARVLDGRRTAG
jgi:hypothetical protein